MSEKWHINNNNYKFADTDSDMSRIWKYELYETTMNSFNSVS